MRRVREREDVCLEIDYGGLGEHGKSGHAHGREGGPEKIEPEKSYEKRIVGKLHCGPE